MRVHEYRVGRGLSSDSGFLSSLDQQHCLSHKYHKSQAGRIFKDRPVSTVWESLSFAAHNVTTSLLLLCSEYSGRKAAVAEGAQSIPSILLPSEGTDGELQAALCYSLKEDKFEGNAEGDTPLVPWSLTLGTTRGRICFIKS